MDTTSGAEDDSESTETVCCSTVLISKDILTSREQMSSAVNLDEYNDLLKGVWEGSDSGALPAYASSDLPQDVLDSANRNEYTSGLRPPMPWETWDLYPLGEEFEELSRFFAQQSESQAAPGYETHIPGRGQAPEHHTLSNIDADTNGRAEMGQGQSGSDLARIARMSLGLTNERLVHNGEEGSSYRTMSTQSISEDTTYFEDQPESAFSGPPNGPVTPFTSPIVSRQSAHSQISILSHQSGLSQSSFRHLCQYPGCYKAFDIPAKLRKHQKYHTPPEHRPHKCEYCAKRFQLPKDLSRHYWTVHQRHVPTECAKKKNANQEGLLFKCGRCDLQFRRKDHLDRHETECTKSVPQTPRKGRRPRRQSAASSSNNSVMRASSNLHIEEPMDVVPPVQHASMCPSLPASRSRPNEEHMIDVYDRQTFQNVGAPNAQMAPTVGQSLHTRAYSPSTAQRDVHTPVQYASACPSLSPPVTRKYRHDQGRQDWY